MRRKTKTDPLDKAIEQAYYKHADGRQIDIMKIGALRRRADEPARRDTDGGGHDEGHCPLLRAERSIMKCDKLSQREKALLAALMSLRAETQPYEDDEALNKAKRLADRLIRRVGRLTGM